MFIILFVMIASWLYTCVKSYQNVQFKYGQYSPFQLYKKLFTKRVNVSFDSFLHSYKPPQRQPWLIVIVTGFSYILINLYNNLVYTHVCIYKIPHIISKF